MQRILLQNRRYSAVVVAFYMHMNSSKEGTCQGSLIRLGGYAPALSMETYIFL